MLFGGMGESGRLLGDVQVRGEWGWLGFRESHRRKEMKEGEKDNAACSN